MNITSFTKSAVAAGLLMAVFAAGCTKKKVMPVCVGCGAPYSGVVIANARDTASAEAVFDLLNSTPGIREERMSGFAYNSALPVDSFEVMKSVIRSKFYIDSSSEVAISPYTGKIHLNFAFLEMSIAQQQEFLALKSRFQLFDTNEQIKIIYLQVAPGQEKYWADQLRGYSIIENADALIIME